MPSSATAIRAGPPSCARPWPTTSAACVAWWPSPSASSSPRATRRGSLSSCRALAAGGARQDRHGGSEQPRRPGHRRPRAGLEAVPIGVDAEGMRVDELARAAPDAVIVTPAHQQPTGVVLSRERRLASSPGCATRRRRDRGRLRRRVPLRPRCRRRAPGARAGADRLRGHDEQDARARAPPRLARRARPSARGGDGTTSWSPTAEPRASRSTHSPTSSRAASSTGTCAACARRYRRQRDAIVRALARGAPGGRGHRHRRRPACDDPAPQGADAEAIRDEAARRRIVFNSMSDYRAEAPRRLDDADARLRIRARTGHRPRRARDRRGRARRRSASGRRSRIARLVTAAELQEQ